MVLISISSMSFLLTILTDATKGKDFCMQPFQFFSQVPSPFPHFHLEILLGVVPYPSESSGLVKSSGHSSICKYPKISALICTTYTWIHTLFLIMITS